jgi:hypothetical protein
MPFDDVPPTHPFYHEIEAVLAAGILRGTSVSPPLFSPETEMTVGELDSWLTRAMHFKDAEREEVDTRMPALAADVPSSHAYFGNVQRAIKAGLHGGPERVDYDPGYVESFGGGGVGGPGENKFSVHFDGTNPYIHVGNGGLNAVLDFTIAAWIKAPTNNDEAVIFYASNEGNEAAHTLCGVSLSINTDGHTFLIRYWQTTIQFNGQYLRYHFDTAETRLDNNVWHHVAMTREAVDNGQTRWVPAMYMYIDGVPIDQAASTRCGDVALAITSAYIGLDRPAGLHGWIGNVDDVRVYERALPPWQIGDLYADRAVDSTGLVGWWRFEEGTGSTVANSALSSPPVGNNGTFTGAGVTWSEDVPPIAGDFVGGGGAATPVPPSRGLATTFIIRALGELPADTGSPPNAQRFSDVAVGSQFYNYVERALELNIVGRTNTAVFFPTTPITRASLAVFIQRAFDVPYVTGPVGPPQGE